MHKRWMYKQSVTIQWELLCSSYIHETPCLSVVYREKMAAPLTAVRIDCHFMMMDACNHRKTHQRAQNK